MDSLPPTCGMHASMVCTRWLAGWRRDRSELLVNSFSSNEWMIRSFVDLRVYSPSSSSSSPSYVHRAVAAASANIRFRYDSALLAWSWRGHATTQPQCTKIITAVIKFICFSLSPSHFNVMHTHTHKHMQTTTKQITQINCYFTRWVQQTHTPARALALNSTCVCVCACVKLV